jgi:3-deoxy-D-manno-octulosonate 8-phosphate phosphatase (KDO 8-P phosphatase)
MKIKILAMDVDGTMTDGHIYMAPTGEAMKAFSAKDGYGIAHLLPVNDIVPVIITGRTSKIVENRAKEIGITELYQGVSDKLAAFKAVAEKYGAEPAEIAFIGDDLNDLDCILFAGVSGAPADAAESIKQRVSFVCTAAGGRGAVREFIEYLIKLQEEKPE